MVLKKHEIEAALAVEAQAISSGKLKEDSPLDLSEDFRIFCEACRRGDLKVCQEMISKGVNINARDRFDYTPLILASLCGHYEVARLLLENGALCERDTFQGERCLYNALNDRIRNLLLSYDYAKSTNPLQPLAAHITSLLTRPEPKTSDMTLVAYGETFDAHKFILAARSPYFASKLAAAPETTTWKVPQHIPPGSLQVALQYLYLAEVSGTSATYGLDEHAERTVLTGIDKISRQLEIPQLFESITEITDRRALRQRRTEELERGRDQLAAWFNNNVIKHKVVVDTDKVDSIRWDRNNSIFADVLLRADDEIDDEQREYDSESDRTPAPIPSEPVNGIPIGPLPSRASSRRRAPRKSTIYPAHRAMLIRAEYFLRMFSSAFREAQLTPHLQIITVDCSPRVLETILNFLYTEKSDFELDIAIEVLFAADQLFIEKLKHRAALIISTLGNGSSSAVESENPRGETDEDEVLDIYEVIRAGWDTRVPRLEEFGARYIAMRLEHYIDEPEFAEIVLESAKRIRGRQETDTIDLVDDIRYYLSERFRLRFEESGLDEMLQEQDTMEAMEDLNIGNEDVGESKAERATREGMSLPDQEPGPMSGTVIRTLDGEIAGDEFAQDAMNYQILLEKIDTLLEKLNLDA